MDKVNPKVLPSISSNSRTPNPIGMVIIQVRHHHTTIPVSMADTILISISILLILTIISNISSIMLLLSLALLQYQHQIQ